MVEIINANGIRYRSESVSTGISSISFILSDITADEAKAIFSDVTSLTVGNEEDEAYGKYPDVVLESITEYTSGGVSVTMHILNTLEKDLKDIKTSLAEHDEAIAYMMFGGGGVNE